MGYIIYHFQIKDFGTGYIIIWPKNVLHFSWTMSTPSINQMNTDEYMVEHKVNVTEEKRNPNSSLFR